jgi:hypothetical protein
MVCCSLRGNLPTARTLVHAIDMTDLYLMHYMISADLLLTTGVPPSQLKHGFHAYLE